MAFKFDPIRPTPLKESIYNYLKTIPLAVEFLNWCQYSKIISKDEGLIAFTPNVWFGSQWKAVETIFRCLEKGIHWIVFLKGRQEGITTVLNQFDLFYNFKYKNLQSAIVAPDYIVSGEIREQIRTIYEHLPIQARQNKTADNSNFMKFRNNSRIKHFFTTGKQKKKGNMGRSGASNYLHSTESAYFQNLDDWNSFTSTLSQEYPWRLYINESTANMFNFFWEMWEAAKDSNTEHAEFIGWWLKETYVLTDSIELKKYGYDPVQWEQENIDLVKKLYGFEMQIEQLAWWRKKLKEDMSDRGMMTKQDVMLQEFPFTEHDAFRLSGQSFFHARTLEENERSQTTPIKRLMPWTIKGKPELTEFKENPSGKIKIWEDYEPMATYILGADPSFGANPDSNEGAITIYKAFKDKLVQVLEYGDNLIDTFHFTWILISLAGVYSSPQIVEVSGPGRTVISLMDMYKRWVNENKITEKMTVYEYAKKLRQEYLYHRPDTLGTGYCRQWLTTGSTKEPLMFQFQSAYHNGEVEIKSIALIKEMEHVRQEKDKKGIGADEGFQDDLVIASALVVEFWMRYFRTRLMTSDEYEEKKKLKTEEKQMYENNPEKAFMQNLVRGIIKEGSVQAVR